MNKALFLDRDGIINVDYGYVYKKENFEFIDGIFELCQKARKLHYKIIVITNQAGIARGYYTEDDFNKLTLWMHSEFAKHAVIITDTFYCPHHPTNGLKNFKRKCYCRKPAPGMLIKAKEKYKLDLSTSIFIGDKNSDMQAAKNAKIKQRIHVINKGEQMSDIATITVNSIREIVEKIA